MTDTAKPGLDLLNKPEIWGRVLIQTEDHDPLYGMLARAYEAKDIDHSSLKRWLLAYWMFYHPGVASFLAEKPGLEFWRWAHTAAENEIGPEQLGINDEARWPRAHERRHFRGQKCVDAVNAICREYPGDPGEVVVRMVGLDRGGVWTLKQVEKEVTAFPQFGPWIAFKAADMAERVLDRPVKFPKNLHRLYRDPRKGAEMASPLLRVGVDAVPNLLAYFLRDVDASGIKPRKVNIQEVETVLCKWKSARNGHYFIGADTISYHKGMPKWGALSRTLAEHLPPIPDVQQVKRLAISALSK